MRSLLGNIFMNSSNIKEYEELLNKNGYKLKSSFTEEDFNKAKEKEIEFSEYQSTQRNLVESLIF